MKLKRWVTIIFILSLIFNLYFAFQTPFYSDSNAYFNSRQIDSITEDLKPIYEDNLSYSGRTLVFSPLFFYFLAIFQFIFGTIILKIIPALLISSLVLLTFNVVKEITKDKVAILFSTIMAAFIPALISQTLNNISVYSLNLVLIFLLLVSYLRIDEKKYLISFVVLSFLLPLTHPISFLIAISFILYLLITYAEGIKVTKLKGEAITFFIFITILINFLIYKEAFSASGLSIIFQNIPVQILSNYFSGINLIELIIAIGIIPIIFGIAGISFGVFRDRKESVILFSSIILTTLALLVLRLITFDVALLFLGLSLAVTSSLGLEKFNKYIKLTKLYNHKYLINIILFFMIFLALIVPSYVIARDNISNTLSNEEVEALTWIKSNTREKDIIASTIEEGHYITTIAERRNFMDNNFLLIKDINSRNNDLNQLYTTSSVSKAVEVLKQYDIEYIYFSNRAKELYKTTDLKYVEDKTCFRRSFNNEKVTIYRLRC